MIPLTQRERDLINIFFQTQQQQLGNSKPDWFIDYLDLTNPDITGFLNNSAVISQAAFDSLGANKIKAEASITKDINDLSALAQKLQALQGATPQKQ